MKKKWTKTWALLLALTMAGSLLMACQSSKGGSDAAAGDTAKDNAADTAQGADASQDGQDAQTEDTGAQVDPYGPVSEPVTLHIQRILPGGTGFFQQLHSKPYQRAAWCGICI